MTQKNRIPQGAQTWSDLNFWTGMSWKTLQKRIKTDIETIQPDPRLIFRPFIETPLHTVKVIILGREPYVHNDEFNDGLAWSAPTTKNAPRPLALDNMLTEAVRDVGIKEPATGSLKPWARQGVFLWNTIPMSKRGHPYHYLSAGWWHLTKEIIETAYLTNPNVVVVTFEHIPTNYVDSLPKENVITLPTPSKGAFFFSNLYSNINKRLEAAGSRPINWSLA